VTYPTEQTRHNSDDDARHAPPSHEYADRLVIPTLCMISAIIVTLVISRFLPIGASWLQICLSIGLFIILLWAYGYKTRRKTTPINPIISTENGDNGDKANDNRRNLEIAIAEGLSLSPTRSPVRLQRLNPLSGPARLTVTYASLARRL